MSATTSKPTRHGDLKSHLLNEIDAGLQIHTEVDELPIDAFLLVLFLFQDEHVVVEELLKALVGVVDTQLLEAVELQEEKMDVTDNHEKGKMRKHGRWQ